MFEYSPVWPHGSLTPAFLDVYFVVGTNRTHHAGLDIQTSRTMTVVRAGDELTLINTVRLEERGLAELDALGEVRHVVRLGAFHGRDDPFYCDRHDEALLWALPAVTHADGRASDRVLEPGAALPLADGALFEFTSARVPEAALLLAREGGILITCDEIQNWTHVDRFFSPQCGELFTARGMIGPANIPSTWREACQPHVDDFTRLLASPFRHLISAHGEPLRDEAHARVAASLTAAFTA